MKKNKKNIIDLIKKRIRKRIKISSFYKTEKPEHIFFFISSLKETVALFFIIAIILNHLSLPLISIKHFLLTFSIGWLFWKICYTSLISWNRLNKLHQIIKEEQHEIEHHREKEKKELEIMYKAKGFSGKLLEDVIDVLMADDNRLLQVMMQEEMGLVLRSYEHPIKQAFFAAFGVILSSFLLTFAFLKGSLYEFFFVGGLIIVLSSFYSKKENLSFIIVWNLAIVALISFLTFFAFRLL
jgi:hypothetical protein